MCRSQVTSRCHGCIRVDKVQGIIRERGSEQAAAAIVATLTGSDTASALGLSIQSASPILSLCRALIRAGHNPTTRLEAYRGSMLAVRVHSLAAGAALTVDDRRTAFARWKPFSPTFSLAEVSPRIAPSAPALPAVAAPRRAAACAFARMRVRR
jgi:hypothetical protein